MILTPQTGFKEFDLDTWLENNRANKDNNGLLVIFPTNRRMREFSKNLAVSYPGMKITTATIRSVAMKTGRKLDPATRLVPDEILEIFVLNVIDDLRRSEVVPELTRGTVKLIKNTISEFKENGTNLHALLADLAKLNPVSTEKAAFLARVWGLLDEKLSAAGMKEIGDVYLNLQARKSDIPKAFSDSFPGITQIYMSNFIELTTPEVELIEGMATAVNNRIYLDFDYNISNGNLFEKIENIHARLTAAGFKGYTSKSEDHAPEFHRHVKENLFKTYKPAPLKYDNIFEFDGQELYDEVTCAAKEIKNMLLTQKDLQPSDICVLFHRISGFTPWIRAVFESYGLPVNITDRFKTGDFSSVSGLIDLLNVHFSRFDHTAVSRVLTNPSLRGRYGDPVHFKHACAYIKVGSGYGKMHRLFTDSANALSAEGIQVDEDGETTGITASILSALKTIELLHDDLAPLTVDQEPGQFIHNFRHLIGKTGYLAKFLNGKGGSALFNIRALSSYIRSADRLFQVLSDYDNRIRTFEEYLEILIDLSQETRFNLIEQPETGIMITTPDEIRGLKFRHLFICALNEGDFPTRYKPEIFKYDGPAGQIKRHSAEERLLFYQALSAWKGEKNGNLYLTNSRRSQKKENVESFFKREMRGLFTISRIDTSIYDSMIYSGREEWESGIWKDLADNEVKSEIRSRIKDHLQQSNRAEGYEGSNFAGFIDVVQSDETSPGYPVIKRVNEPFAPTALETYANCPYQFFVKHILNLKPVEDLSDDLDARESGILLHGILSAFHTKLLNEKRTVSNCSDDELKEFLREMIEIAVNDQKVRLNELLDTESFIAAEKILGIAGDATMSILWRYLLEARENKTGLIPSLFENRFGGLSLTGLGSEKISAPYEIRIHGTIDRIDINPDKKVYKVIDYKSGKNDYAEKDIASGRKLQIPVYLLATVKGKVTGIPEDHLYLFPQIFSLKYKEDEFGPKEVAVPRGVNEDTHETAERTWTNLLSTTEENIRKFVLGIYEGKFPLTSEPAREEKACKYCEFSNLCRVKEHKPLEAAQNPSGPASLPDPME